MVKIFDLSGNLLWDGASCAYLRDADLTGVDLSGANLRGAYLRGANLRYAYLSCADLTGADLCGADLCDADLRGAKLTGAKLTDACLIGAKNIPDEVAKRLLITPEGVLIGWKKLEGGTICKLEIPADARRFNATGRKCRAEFAKVLEGEGCSRHDSTFKYIVGEIVRPRKPFDPDRWNECASGIHFFLTRKEAENY